MQEERARAAAERLDRFAARALDWPAVREIYLAKASSPLGMRALHELAPREDADAREALERSREMQATLEAGEAPPLEGNVDPLPVLERAVLYGSALAVEDLWTIARFLRVLEDAAQWLGARRAGLPRCAALWTGMPEMAFLREEIEAVVDGRGRVVDHASPLLARLRGESGSLVREIERRVKDLAGRPELRAALAEGHAGAVHRRGGRLVLAVRARHAGRVPGMVHDRSQSGETVFIEPEEVIEASNRVAGLEADSEREASRILSELTRSVLARRVALETCASRAAELELALVSARYGRGIAGRPARLPGGTGAHAELLLRAFRHPLLLESQRAGRLAAVVPLDLRLGADFDLLVITGPNTGGKTLAVKAAGLAVLLTRMGLSIPCEEGTTVPLFDGIVADIGDEQAIEQNLSTFASHLSRIRDGLARTTRNTMVLLDELGGGTDPAEGAALAEALLEHLLAIGAPTLASTHLGKLKEFAYSFARAENAHVEFDLETLAPRHRLVIGAPGESRALAAARRLGLDRAILARAEERLERRDDEVELLMGQMREVKLAAERLRNEAEARSADFQTKIRALEQERDEQSTKRSQLESEAQRGVEERVARARPWVERARGLCGQLQSAARAELEAALLGLEVALGGALLSDRRRAFLEGLKKGDHVWIPRFKKRLQVLRIHRERREIELQLGNRHLTVAFDDVTFYESL